MIDAKAARDHIFDVVGALFNVHNGMGPGLNETCYQEALQIELQNRGIPFEREWAFHPTYHGNTLQCSFRLDFLCKEDIIIECKAVESLTTQHRAQLYNYMRLLQFPYGIIVNFANKSALIERYYYDRETGYILGSDTKPLFRIGFRDCMLR